MVRIEVFFVWVSEVVAGSDRRSGHIEKCTDAEIETLSNYAFSNAYSTLFIYGVRKNMKLFIVEMEIGIRMQHGVTPNHLGYYTYAITIEMISIDL